MTGVDEDFLGGGGGCLKASVSGLRVRDGAGSGLTMYLRDREEEKMALLGGAVLKSALALLSCAHGPRHTTRAFCPIGEAGRAALTHGDTPCAGTPLRSDPSLSPNGLKHR